MSVIREELQHSLNIEGNPFITRFKTTRVLKVNNKITYIEGNPFITRFKTRKGFIKS